MIKHIVARGEESELTASGHPVTRPGMGWGVGGSRYSFRVSGGITLLELYTFRANSYHCLI